MPVTRDNEVRHTLYGAFEDAIVVFIGAKSDLPLWIDPLSPIPKRRARFANRLIVHVKFFRQHTGQFCAERTGSERDESIR